jgi:hypothetical protein
VLDIVLAQVRYRDDCAAKKNLGIRNNIPAEVLPEKKMTEMPIFWTGTVTLATLPNTCDLGSVGCAKNTNRRSVIASSFIGHARVCPPNVDCGLHENESYYIGLVTATNKKYFLECILPIDSPRIEILAVQVVRISSLSLVEVHIIFEAILFCGRGHGQKLVI